jgi:23S rRNA pseudouridine1911/1915/1917 synthase
MTPGDLIHFTHDDEAGERLDRLIAAAFADLSRSRGKTLIEQGAVTVDTTTITNPSYRVKQGVTVTVSVPHATPTHLEPQAIPLDIRYEDADVLVLDKPAGLVVHPAPGHYDGTLVNALLAHCGDSLSGISGIRRPGIVHRIDKDTSGLLVVAKNDTAHAGLAKQFANHTIDRTYTAVVWGSPTPAEGIIDGNIGRSPRNRKKMAVQEERRGKAARTHYKVTQRLGLRASLITCRLETGRTHQIRVHCTYIGHPLIGDPLYGRLSAARLDGLDPDSASFIRQFPRQALHASVIGFVHPKNGNSIRVESNLPIDINKLIGNLKG